MPAAESEQKLSSQRCLIKKKKNSKCRHTKHEKIPVCLGVCLDQIMGGNIWLPGIILHGSSKNWFIFEDNSISSSVPLPPPCPTTGNLCPTGGGGASLDKWSKKKWRVSPAKTNFHSGASRRKLWAILGNVRELNRRKLLSIIKEKSLLQKNNNTSLFAHFNIYCIFKKYWGDAQFLNAPLTLRTQNAALRLPVAINQMNKCTNDDAHFSLNVC